MCFITNTIKKKNQIDRHRAVRYIFQFTFCDCLAYLKKYILIPDRIKKQLGPGFRFLAGSGFNEYGTGTETLGSQISIR